MERAGFKAGRGSTILNLLRNFALARTPGFSMPSFSMSLEQSATNLCAKNYVPKTTIDSSCRIFLITTWVLPAQGATLGDKGSGKRVSPEEEISPSAPT